MRRFMTTHMPVRARRFLSAQGGATAIEYALIAAGVSVAIVTSVTALGSQIMVVFYDKLTNMF